MQASTDSSHDLKARASPLITHKRRRKYHMEPPVSYARWVSVLGAKPVVLYVWLTEAALCHGATEELLGELQGDLTPSSR